MENNRTHCFFKKSGVALVNTLIIVAASLLLIVGIYYLLGGGFKIAIINKKFSTSQEAAAGGAQQTTEAINQLLNDYNNGATSSCSLSCNMGFQSYTGAANVIFYCQQQSPPLTTALRAKTADGRYQIDMTVACLGQKPVAGSGGAMIFPPPPTSGGGGGTAYYFYSIISEAKDMSDTRNPSIGKVEAVYRLTR